MKMISLYAVAFMHSLRKNVMFLCLEDNTRGYVCLFLYSLGNYPSFAHVLLNLYIKY